MEHPSQAPFEDNVTPPGDGEGLGIYEQVAAEQAALRASEQEAEQQVAAEQAAQQAVEEQRAIDQAEASSRLTRRQRRLYEGIARAAGVGDLPDGVSKEDVASVRTFSSNRVTAAANFAALQQDAAARLVADKRYREKQRQEAEQDRKQRQTDAMLADAIAENDKFDSDAIKLNHELGDVFSSTKDRVHREKLASIDDRIAATLAKHPKLSQQSRDMMSAGLRDQLTRQAATEAEAAAKQAAEERKAYIRANGGSDAIMSIRGREAAEAHVADEEAKRQAFLDRLHNRVPVGHRQTAEVTAVIDQQSPYLSAGDRQHLQAVAKAKSSAELPEGVSPDDLRAVRVLNSNPVTAAANFAALQKSAKDRLKSDEAARNALVERARRGGIGNFTDEEIAALPASGDEFMSDDDVTLYLHRMQEIRAKEVPKDGRNDRNPRGYQSFSGSASGLKGELEYQQSLLSNPTPPTKTPASKSPDVAPVQKSDSEGVNKQDDWNGPTARIPVVGEGQPVDPARLEPKIRSPFPLSKDGRKVAWGGGMDPDAPLPTTPAVVSPSQSVDLPPARILTARELREAERAQMSLPARAWDTVSRHWPGVSKTSWENDRPSIPRGIVRGAVVAARWSVERIAAMRQRKQNPPLRTVAPRPGRQPVPAGDARRNNREASDPGVDILDSLG